jgi:hypothetical protein
MESTTRRGTDPLDREFAAGWAPDAGDKTRGTVTAIDRRDAGFGQYSIYVLELTDGYTARTTDGEMVTDEIAVHAQRDVLRRKLANANVAVGDEIGVKYQGPPQGTARSHRYRVLRYLSDGSYVEASYDDELDKDEAQAELELDADTQAAFQHERDERDAAVSVHAPLEG